MTKAAIDYFDLKKHEEEFANIYILSSDDKKLIFHKCMLVKNKWFKENLLDGSVNLDGGIKLPFVGYFINHYLNWLSDHQYKKSIQDVTNYPENYVLVKILYSIAHFVDDKELQSICIDSVINCSDIDSELIHMFQKYKLSTELLFGSILNGIKSLRAGPKLDINFINDCVTYGINQQKHIDIMIYIIPYYSIDKRLFMKSIDPVLLSNDEKSNNKKLIENIDTVLKRSKCWIDINSGGGTAYLYVIGKLLLDHIFTLNKKVESLTKQRDVQAIEINALIKKK